MKDSALPSTTDVKSNTKIESVVCKISSRVVVAPQSQRLVPFSCSYEPLESNSLLFEPVLPMPVGCLVGRSFHVKSSRQLYCNIVNANSTEIILVKDQVIGNMSVGAIVEETFEEKVKNYVYVKPPSPVARPGAGKTFSSMPEDSVRKNNIDSIRTGKLLTEEQRDALRAVLLKNYDAFQWDGDPIGRTNLVEHSIPTGNTRPIITKQYPIPTIAQESMRAQVASMLKNKVIRPSKSPWRSPILLVKKILPDGTVTYRFCLDLKKVNDATTKDSYSLPRISETIDALSGAQFLSTSDVDRAYWQVGVTEADIEKLAFGVEGKIYECPVMPFGSMNAPATFQRLMDRVLMGLTWKQCLVYIDDVLIFSKSFDQHLRDIDEVLARFIYAKLKLKPSKCVFANHEVDYLGFKISNKGLQASNKKVEALLRVAPPLTTKLLHSFLCSFKKVPLSLSLLFW